MTTSEAGADPRVSIVIPVYNGANYLAQAIDSALAQTYSNVEVVVVDDGSTDGGETERVARGYGDRIRYLRKENGGVATALNAGIEVMTGEYFSWLSHDDLYLPERVALQVQAAAAAGPRPVVVYSAFEMIDAGGAVLGDGLAIPRYDDPVLAVFDSVIHGCSLLVPRRCFEMAGGFDPALPTTCDVDMWLRLMLAGFEFRFVPRVLVQSRQHAEQGSLTIARHAQNRRDWYFGALEQIGPAERARRRRTLPPILLRKEEVDGAFWHLVRITRGEEGAVSALGLVAAHVPLLAAQYCLPVLRLPVLYCRRFLGRAARAIGLRR